MAAQCIQRVWCLITIYIVWRLLDKPVTCHWFIVVISLYLDYIVFVGWINGILINANHLHNKHVSVTAMTESLLQYDCRWRVSVMETLPMRRIFCSYLQCCRSTCAFECCSDCRTWSQAKNTLTTIGRRHNDSVAVHSSPSEIHGWVCVQREMAMSISSYVLQQSAYTHRIRFHGV